MKQNKKALNEKWSKVVTNLTGVKNPARLEWMAQLAHNQALNEADGWNGTNVMGGAAQQAPGAMGGAYQPYNTLYNTLGIGNAVPAGRPALTGADYADNSQLGSGDKFPTLLPLALKVAAKTIGLDLVNTIPTQGPNGVLPYMDYVYSNSKQPYGATPGMDAATANPHMFQYKTKAHELYGLPAAVKLDVVAEDGAARLAAIKEMKATLRPGSALKADKLDLEFIGWSRIDGTPMFKVVSGTASLGTIFEEGAVEFAGDVTVTLGQPRLISMLEDQIQGYVGSGRHDDQPWYGTYQDGRALYEPMSRAQGEMHAARQISLQLFTKNITVGTIAISAAVTQEQVQDLQKQWGIDAMKMIENAAINELSATINRHITSRLFALGWKNHCKLVEVEGQTANMNFSFASAEELDARPQGRATVDYAIPQGEATATGYTEWTNVPMEYKPLFLVKNAAFENKDTLMKRLYENFLKASNWILQRGRYGHATFAVTNITVATQLQTNAQYGFSPFANNISQNGGALYSLGTIAGMTIYVDPLMGADDCRVLVGRKGAKDEPGVFFMPYLMAESVKIISEGTMAPKLQIKSRYNLVDAGFYPECQYITFAVDFAGLV